MRKPKKKLTVKEVLRLADKGHGILGRWPTAKEAEQILAWADDLIQRQSDHERTAIGVNRPTAGRRRHDRTPSAATFTHQQGQFLAFIHLYRKLHRQGPAETDMVKFFGLTPHSVHGMVVRLTQLGRIAREEGVARSIRVTVPEKEIPALDDTTGPPW